VTEALLTDPCILNMASVIFQAYKRLSTSPFFPSKARYFPLVRLSGKLGMRGLSEYIDPLLESRSFATFLDDIQTCSVPNISSEYISPYS